MVIQNIFGLSLNYDTVYIIEAEVKQMMLCLRFLHLFPKRLSLPSNLLRFAYDALRIWNELSNDVSLGHLSFFPSERS